MTFRQIIAKYSPVDCKNGRDYSKPTLESQVSRVRNADGKDRQKQWLKIISIPMGGQNKKH